ncbi:MAG TPA: hypothetical protein VM711_04660 [Sphingomicrobium sp.]|nr:hypothetical protein [Sphingomicrobium sp.]
MASSLALKNDLDACGAVLAREAVLPDPFGNHGEEMNLPTDILCANREGRPGREGGGA